MQARVVLLAETFGRNMGYLQNLLPKYLSRRGLDVHVLTLDLAPYYQFGDPRRIYGDFLAETELKAGTVERLDGFSLHILAHRQQLGYMRMLGFYAKIRELRPDVVMTSVSVGWLALDAAIGRILFGYKLFTGNHTGLSVLPPQARPSNAPSLRKLGFVLQRALPGRIISLLSSRCYAVTRDCAVVAQRIMGVQPRKIEVLHLGVDTDVFHPPDSPQSIAERRELRRSLEVEDDEILCVYSGKMNRNKNALVVALAIKRLREQGRRYAALFIGEGEQVAEVAQVEGCRVLGFMNYAKLGGYYRAADIGVWPGDESTSTLDAAACGLPLIVSDGIGYFDHVDGNGLVYRRNDVDDLVAKMLELESSAVRQRLGACGATKMAERFSWNHVADVRYRDIVQVLAS